MDRDSQAFTARPAAYALESSDGESDWDEAPNAPKLKKELKPEAVVSFGGAPIRESTAAFFLVGEAGEAIARGVSIFADQAVVTTVQVDGAQVSSFASFFAILSRYLELTTYTSKVGTIHQHSKEATLIFLSSSLPLGLLHPLSSSLVSALAPTSTTILSSYHLPSYISASSTSPSPQILHLRSTGSESLKALTSSGHLSPFAPPNLLHGLSSSLLMLASLSSPSLLILLPSITPPQPLNGPFTFSAPSSVTSYDIGGATNLSTPGALYGEIKPKLKEIAKTLGWKWWNDSDAGGKGFSWLDDIRKRKRKEDVGAMFM